MCDVMHRVCVHAKHTTDVRLTGTVQFQSLHVFVCVFLFYSDSR